MPVFLRLPASAKQLGWAWEGGTKVILPAELEQETFSAAQAPEAGAQQTWLQQEKAEVSGSALWSGSSVKGSRQAPRGPNHPSLPLKVSNSGLYNLWRFGGRSWGGSCLEKGGTSGRVIIP